jgi:hypothetical protein
MGKLITGNSCGLGSQRHQITCLKKYENPLLFLHPLILKTFKKIGTRRSLISDFSEKPKLEFIEKN